MRDHDDSNCHCHQVHSVSLSSSSFRVIVIKFIPCHCHQVHSESLSSSSFRVNCVIVTLFPSGKNSGINSRTKESLPDDLVDQKKMYCLCGLITHNRALFTISIIRALFG